MISWVNNVSETANGWQDGLMRLSDWLDECVNKWVDQWVDGSKNGWASC